MYPSPVRSNIKKKPIQPNGSLRITRMVAKTLLTEDSLDLGTFKYSAIRELYETELKYYTLMKRSVTWIESPITEKCKELGLSSDQIKTVFPERSFTEFARIS
eukprot:TRINITY_DN22431_c0_g1_i1.p1 TRINITY_DN22431_c0_g1~~TRINITY_DN22431_c0_g1_i1.p1  ORF type:complete len:103 (+),score=1.59 TRINITY_DN22431_c0_g1_i1:270-578(+)